jgi:hypothetical protein
MFAKNITKKIKIMPSPNGNVRSFSSVVLKTSRTIPQVSHA